MANKERGEMRLVAGDDTYTLKLTVNSCCELEDRCNRLFDAIVDGVNKGSVRDVRWLLWATLQEYHGDEFKTPHDAGRFIDRAGGLAAVAAQMHDFMTLNADDSDPEEREAGKANPPAAEAANGNGSISTPAALASRPTNSGASRSRNSGANSRSRANVRRPPSGAIPS